MVLLSRFLEPLGLVIALFLLSFLDLSPDWPDTASDSDEHWEGEP